MADLNRVHSDSYSATGYYAGIVHMREISGSFSPLAPEFFSPSRD
jgi:hypothetical protein